MTIEIWTAYVVTVLVLMSTPGPSKLLMLSNSMRHGFRPSIATAAGDLSANVLQMVVAATGLVGLLATSEHFFSVIKWCGVAYLAFLGIRMLLSDSDTDLSATRAARSGLYMQGFLTSAANPKAVIFFAALFPQFINPAEAVAAQLILLGGTYILLDGLFLAAYGGLADRLASLYRDRIGQSLNRISGGCLLVVAILLGLKPVEGR